ncbi:MAG: zinc-ribbon domain-containing protein [Myxococcota bacterium]
MDISCPACATRYRLDVSRIPPQGARISCTSCDHSFVAHRPGTSASSTEATSNRGVAVTIARHGKLSRVEQPIEDDDDAPTTLMAKNSELLAELRAEMEAIQEEEAAQKGGRRQAFKAPPSSAPEAPAPAAAEPEPPPQVQHDSDRPVSALRSAARETAAQQRKTRGKMLYLVMATLLLVCAGAAVAYLYPNAF